MITTQSPLKSLFFLPIPASKKQKLNEAQLVFSFFLCFLLALKRWKALSREREPYTSTWAEKWSLMTLKQCRRWEVVTATATVESIFDKFNCQENCSRASQLTAMWAHFTLQNWICAQSGNSNSSKNSKNMSECPASSTTYQIEL